MITVIGLIGYSGRMGQSIAQIVATHPSAALGGAIVRHPVPQDKNNPAIFTDNPADLFPHCDVIVDFSHPSATALYARLAAKAGKPFLSGTTGLEENAKEVLRDVAKDVPVLYATNTSLSLVVAKHMARLGAQLLKNEDYDASILDKHHKWKKDAPSGTAVTLGLAVAEGSDNKIQPSYASLRGGAVVGEHEVMFAGQGETIIVKHSVTDRRVFARGAVQAALWLAAQKPGHYGMDDVLGL